MLNVEGLSKRFGKKTAVDGLSFSVEAGNVLGLLGPNGAGKTTTFLCLTGLLRPDAGSISLGGKLLPTERAAQIALIPETPEVYPMLTVWEHLAFVARSMRIGAGWEARANDLLGRLGMTDQRDTLGNELSKGMRQKTLIAVTMLTEAPVILLDEPMVGLDPRGQRELRTLIAEMRAAGHSILVSTHIIESATAICDRFLIMKAGRAVASGSAGELLAENLASSTFEDVFLELTR